MRHYEQKNMFWTTLIAPSDPYAPGRSVRVLSSTFGKDPPRTTVPSGLYLVRSGGRRWTNGRRTTQVPRCGFYFHFLRAITHITLVRGTGREVHERKSPRARACPDRLSTLQKTTGVILLTTKRPLQVMCIGRRITALGAVGNIIHPRKRQSFSHLSLLTSLYRRAANHKTLDVDSCYNIIVTTPYNKPYLKVWLSCNSYIRCAVLR